MPLELHGSFSHKKEEYLIVGVTMDSSDFDSQSRQHLNVYKGFMNFSMASIAAVVVVLVLMAVFLL